MFYEKVKEIEAVVHVDNIQDLRLLLKMKTIHFTIFNGL